MKTINVYSIYVNGEWFTNKDAKNEADAIHQTEQQIKRLDPNYWPTLKDPIIKTELLYTKNI